jgi:glycine/D-amino acid oxidase-like deaminating enzyme
VQSEELPPCTDYAIIGSGVTGCSIAKTLLEESSPSPKACSVTVFEARTLTSGATGRNGGVLASFVPGDYKILSERFGHDQAVEIARFANSTLEKMHRLANSSEELKEASEVRRTMDVLCVEDEEAFQAAQESLSLYEEHVPEERGKAQYLTAQEAESVGPLPVYTCCSSLTRLDRSTM